jgi:hypothetical protein
VAIAWAVATLLALAALSGGPGISRDEAAVLAAADRALTGGTATEDAPRARPAAPLAATLAGATEAVLSRAGLSHLRSARFATALFGALLSAALALLAWDLAGRAAALLAPALFWAAPRHLHAGLVATPDLALAALCAATVAAYRRAAVAPDRPARVRAAAAAGLLFGVALAVRVDAWILLPALAVHAALSRALRSRARVVEPGGTRYAVLALATLGPLVLVAAWPSLLSRPWPAFAPGPATGLRELAVATALTVPATVLSVYLAGVAHALARAFRAARGTLPVWAAADEVLLLLCAAAPFAAAAAGIAPAAAGVRPWLHATPFLAVLGARALLAAAREAWPARAAPLAGSLAVLVLWPGVRAAAHFHPAGASAWNELAGGAPGAATLGRRRQDGGEGAILLLEALNARAREGARVYWPTSSPAAVRALARDGRLRADLAAVETPEEADLAVVTLDGGSRDAEYRIWSAFRTARPAAGAYLDEVPLAFVYARPGAWR